MEITANLYVNRIEIIVDLIDETSILTPRITNWKCGKSESGNPSEKMI